jgi:DNA-binding NtrC family response regulator
MRHPKIVVFETDGLVARQLADLIDSRRWLLREVRQVEACLKCVTRSDPVVFVLKIGRNLQRELSLLRDAHLQSPDTSIIVISDNDDPLLEALCYDLGATFVLQPPLPRQRLAELVERVMRRCIERVSAQPVLAAESKEDIEDEGTS